MNAQENVAISADGLPIHYDVHGTGLPALVFVHGWSCDRSYWDRQVRYFAPHYTVVRLDLAGHGASGRDRPQWTVAAFGQDIVAVVEQLGLEQVVLIGHSVGGQWIVEAARRLPTAVIGLVEVDAWHNVEQTPTPAQVAESLAPFRTNFVEAARTFVQGMFVPTSDPTLVEQVVAAMSAAPPHIGIGVLEEGRGNGRNLQEVKAPKIAINSGSYRPTNREAAQRYGIEVVLVSGVGHFVMLEDPQTLREHHSRNSNPGSGSHDLRLPLTESASNIALEPTPNSLVSLRGNVGKSPLPGRDRPSSLRSTETGAALGPSRPLRPEPEPLSGAREPAFCKVGPARSRDVTAPTLWRD